MKEKIPISKMNQKQKNEAIANYHVIRINELIKAVMDRENNLKNESIADLGYIKQYAWALENR